MTNAADSETADPEQRVAGRDLVKVQVCERRPGIQPVGEPFGRVRVEFRMPRNMKRWFEDATVNSQTGDKGLNLVFDGHLLPTKGGGRTAAEASVVVTEPAAELLEVRVLQLRLEVGRLEAQAASLSESHAQMVKTYGAEQDRIAASTARAQETLDALRASHKEEDGLKSARIVAALQAEKDVTDIMRDRVRSIGENLREAVNQEAKVTNTVTEWMADAKSAAQKGGKIAATVDAVAETGMRVLDHPMVSRAVGGLLTKVFGGGAA